MLRIAIEKSIPYIEGLLDDKFIIKYLSNNEFNSSTIKDCDAIIVRSTTICNKELLDNTNVKFISTATAGFDHIDTEYCSQNGIKWQNCKGCNCISVAQYVMSTLSQIILSSNKKLNEIKLAIVGVGYTGGALLNMANTIGIETMLCDPYREEAEGNSKLKFHSIQEVFNSCDVISLHVPLTKSGKYPTFHMVDHNLINKLKTKPIIINACRGSVVDTKSIIEAYNNQLLSNLITDCWENEPNIDTQLLDISSIATPHIAGFSADSKQKSTIMSCNNILSWAKMENITDTKIKIEEPSNKLINLNNIPEAKQIPTAIIKTTKFDEITSILKKHPSEFKEIRKNYERPREFSSYTITGASKQNSKILSGLGFNLLDINIEQI